MKKQVTLRIDEDVLKWFKSGGKGYHGRMNDALRLHTKRVDILNIVDDFKYKDIPIKFEAYLCWECGAEYGKEGK